MKQFFTVFKFEFAGHLKNKVLIGLTIAIVVIFGIVLSYPRFTAYLDKSDIELPSFSDNEDASKLAIKNNSEIPDEILVDAFNGAFSDGYEITLLDEVTDKDMEAKVKSGDYDTAFIIESTRSYRYIVDTVGMYDVESAMASQLLLTLHRNITMASAGLTDEQILDVLDSNIDCETIVTGKDQTQSFGYTYAIVMILYMVLVYYGQFVANGVATEKSSRAMEVLITSAKPINLMFGKVLGAGCAGLIQVAIIIFSAFGFYKLNEDVVDNEMLESLFGMPLNVALYSILFFVLGFFIYAFMYGAAGSLTSRIEDLGTISMPIMLVYIAAFMLAIIGMTGDMVDGTLFRVCSFLPTFAPMIMLVRICMGAVATWEVVLSIVIQVLSIIASGFLCAKIYRAGVLMYGNTPKIKDIFKILKSAETMK